MGGFLIIIVIFVAGWFLLAVPARRRRASHAAMQDAVGVGDEVITAGGIHGTVREITDDLVDLEIAPSVVVKLDRRAIAAVAREIEVEPQEAEDAEDAERDSGPAPEESSEPS